MRKVTKSINALDSEASSAAEGGAEARIPSSKHKTKNPRQCVQGLESVPQLPYKPFVLIYCGGVPVHIAFYEILSLVPPG